MIDRSPCIKSVETGFCQIYDRQINVSSREAWYNETDNFSCRGLLSTNQILVFKTSLLKQLKEKSDFYRTILANWNKFCGLFFCRLTERKIYSWRRFDDI